MRVYTVACIEAPAPAEPLEPVRMAAAGPVDAFLKAGPLFSEPYIDRPRQPFAKLEIIAVEPAGPWLPDWHDAERVEVVDDE